MIIKSISKCEAYEVDFIGVGKNEAKQDADAICFRWKDGNGDYKIAIYDAGFKPHGEAMVNHLNKYYFNDPDDKLDKSQKYIDYVFASHPHNDHVSGIPIILDNFSIGCIYMNMPWLYTDELLKIADSDGRSTEKTLEEELREDYSLINDIEKQARKQRIEIRPAFAGTKIDGGVLRILSPGRGFYLQKVIESKKTQRIQPIKEECSFSENGKELRDGAYESWSGETLGDEHVETDAENDTSIVLYGFKDRGGMLLCGDAGVESLENAEITARRECILLKDDVKFVEIPHHGGRHNVSTALLDQLFGSPLVENEEANKTAYVSVAEGSDHPRKVVVNAYIRRGFKVFKTDGGIRWHHSGDMPRRNDFYKSTDNLDFNHWVEEW
ncbi:MAG: hypothetical protein E7232_15140 [Lachnospiraceae bacterium]|jgi:beta-lactamase superfamily II metal-dependent hydrolase|nr:hypothetical protein [Lachnospiraceae bacterium]